jgi:hypothetical protein
VRQQGRETYKPKLTIQYYKLLESSKEVVGPVSTQELVDWRLGERGLVCGDVTQVLHKQREGGVLSEVLTILLVQSE